MTKTINELRKGLDEIERKASLIIEIERGSFTATGFKTGMGVAASVVGMTLLDLTVKGLLPEGRYGRIMDTINTALAASEEKIIDGAQAEMSGAELPPAGQ